jgi:hypothetical protein
MDSYFVYMSLYGKENRNVGIGPHSPLSILFNSSDDLIGQLLINKERTDYRCKDTKFVKRMNGNSNWRGSLNPIQYYALHTTTLSYLISQRYNWTADKGYVYGVNGEKKMRKGSQDQIWDRQSNGDFQLRPLLLRPLEHFPMQFTLNISS